MEKTPYRPTPLVHTLGGSAAEVGQVRVTPFPPGPFALWIPGPQGLAQNFLPPF